jgi:hypothetical protein
VFLCVATTLSAAGCSPPSATTGPAPAPKPAPLTGTLTVLARPPIRTKDVVPISEPGALPVQSDGAMCLDVELDEPAFVYLVWFDAAGQVLPLYPWNNETLEIKDVSAPPPERRGTKRIFSPMLGRSWTFGKQPGAETVVLLARRAALPADVNLAELLKSPIPSALENDSAPVEVQIPPGKAASADSPNQTPLRSSLQPLAQHFELIHAVQFKHAGKTSE